MSVLSLLLACADPPAPTDVAAAPMPAMVEAPGEAPIRLALPYVEGAPLGPLPRDVIAPIEGRRGWVKTCVAP